MSSSDLSGSFTRCRKSYAPNARNRRRASSVHRQQSSPLDCGTTTALVVVHADDEEVLLNSNRPRAHSFTPLTTLASQAALHYSPLNRGDDKALPHSFGETNPSYITKKGGKERKTSQSKRPPSLNSCFGQTVTASPLCVVSRANLAHPRYREALIM